MKKLFLLGSLCCLSVTALADGGPIDGKTVKRITFDGAQVTIEYNNGTATTTSDMSEVVIDMSNAASIEEREALSKQYGVEGKPVYNLQGQQVGSSAARLEKGVYIIDGKKVIINK